MNIRKEGNGMKIYVLDRMEIVNYDEYYGKVIVAKDEWRAREIANENVGDEGKIWNDPTRVSCKEVDKKCEGVVLSAFCAG